MIDAWKWNLLGLTTAALLVVLNGFFVAAEFALVKVRTTRLNQLAQARRHSRGRLSGWPRAWTARCRRVSWESRWPRWVSAGSASP